MKLVQLPPILALAAAGVAALAGSDSPRERLLDHHMALSERNGNGCDAVEPEAVQVVALDGETSLYAVPCHDGAPASLHFLYAVAKGEAEAPPPLEFRYLDGSDWTRVKGLTMAGIAYDAGARLLTTSAPAADPCDAETLTYRWTGSGFELKEIARYGECDRGNGRKEALIRFRGECYGPTESTALPTGLRLTAWTFGPARQGSPKRN